MGRTCCVQKLFFTFRTINVHNMFSQCSVKIRASNKDLPVKEFHCWYFNAKVRSVTNFKFNVFLDVDFPILNINLRWL